MSTFIASLRRYSLRDVLLLAVTAFLYIVAAKQGLVLASVHPSATAVWPPTGISIALLLLIGYRMWPAVFLGAFFVNATTYGNFFTTFGIALGNTLEGVLAVYLLRRFANGANAFEHHWNVLKFFVLGGLVATALSAMIGVTSLALGGFAEWEQYWAIWFTWWLGDFGGAIVVAPFLLALVNFFRGTERARNFRLRSLLPVATMTLFGLVVFNELFIEKSLPISSLALPILVWAASRAGRIETSATILALAATSLWGTTHGLGPFGALPPNEALVLLQAYLGVMSLTTFALSAFQSEVARGVEELKQFREAVDNASDHISITDQNGIVLYMNKAAERITGFSRDEALGKKAGAKELWGGLMEKEFYKKMWKILKEDKKPFVSECTNRRKDGKLYPIQMTISPVLDERDRVKFFVEIERDISKEKELEQARMDFLSLASHQLRTPLSGTKWLIETLLRGLTGSISTEQKDYLTYIYQVNKRMLHLVSDMLDVLKIESGEVAAQKSDVSLEKVCQNILLMTEASAQKRKVAVHCDLNMSDFKLRTDQELFRQILQSFLSNAIEYSPEGGEVFVSVERTDDVATFTVRDSGIGVPKEEQSRIFERFYRATNAKRTKPDGTGLGLYIADMLAKKIGATISFESEEGKGATFSVRVPL